ncbi:MAG: protein kinase [Clostridia bacterium]|nr:protein kinase [Clostridia bacterium]
MTGTVLENRYTIESELGIGGMAEVYLARDSVEDRQVAVKMIKREYCSDPQYTRRFEREAKAVLSLDCPNIVRAYGFGEYDGRNYIILEYVEGMTLKEYLGEHGRLSPRAAVHIACRVLNALEAAHGGGYVHRDVKPQNVLISTDKTIKLTDFGIAKDTASNTITFNGKNVVGSVHYISPEQVSGDPVSPQSDLYSVGVMLYEMLLGHPPFDGETPVQIAYKQVNERLVPPMEEDASISPALSDVIVKATAKDPANRYPSAEAMKSDLIRALREPENRFAFLDPDVVTRHASDEEEPEGPVSRARLWHFILPAALIVALVIGMIAGLAVFGNGNKENLSKVPDLLDRTLEEATTLLKNREFEIRVAGTISDPDYPSGNVCRQSPESGTAYEKGATVDVWLSSGAPSVNMTDLVGMTLEEAAEKLAAVSIGIDSISYESSDAAEGTIIWQSIPEGTEIVPGEETVSVIISGWRGVTLVPMPDLSSVATLGGVNQILDVYGAVNRRFSFGLGYKGSSNASGRLVEDQYPSAGLPFLPASTRVEIYLNPDLALEATAEISFDLPAEDDDRAVDVVLLSEYGEFTLYENTLPPSETATHIRFIAGYLQEGEYEIVVLSGGAEILRLTAVFTN